MRFSALVVLMTLTLWGLPGCGSLLVGAPEEYGSAEGLEGGQVETPRLSVWQRVLGEGVNAWIIVGGEPSPGAGWSPGAFIVCRVEGVLQLGAYFGPFPPDARLLQFSVQLPDQSIERYGPVFRGGAAAGFHEPVISDDPAAARRMGLAIATPGALVSNGYFSFWNVASPEDNQAVRDYIDTCMS